MLYATCFAKNISKYHSDHFRFRSLNIKRIVTAFPFLGAKRFTYKMQRFQLKSLDRFIQLPVMKCQNNFSVTKLLNRVENLFKLFQYITWWRSLKRSSWLTSTFMKDSFSYFLQLLYQSYWRIPNFFYIQVIVFDLGYLAKPAV